MKKEKIKQIISETINTPIEDIKDESKLIEDLGIDSVDFIEIIISCEEEFDILIPDEKLDVFQALTFDKFFEFVEENCEKS
jgi:acyl carrier protein